MSIDWDRRTCARKGHITYAPDELRLRGRLHASTAVGEVWRCLRCGDFVLGDPHGSGPADQAPLVPRGRALRDLFILRFLAVERILRGLLIVVAAWAVWKFSNSQDAVRRLFEDDLTAFKPAASHFHYDLDHSPVVDSIRKFFDYKKSTLKALTVPIAIGIGNRKSDITAYTAVGLAAKRIFIHLPEYAKLKDLIKP